VRQDGRGSVLAVIQDAAVISVTSQLSSGPSVMTYGLDGREIHSIDRTAVPAVPGSRRPFAGDVQVSKGEWRGTDLVLSDTYASGSTQTQVWSLDSSGVLHVEVIKGPPDRPDSRHTVTFTRQ
jgi:hypothetical protein